MAKTRIEIYDMEDGFWAGHRKKDGKMADGAYRLTDEDIMTMFTKLVNRKLDETGEDRFLMRDSEGNLFATARAAVRRPEETPAEPKRKGRRKSA